MTRINLYKSWRRAEYIRRPNRFVMELDTPDGPLKAYVPTTGRMSEFRFPGHPFFIAAADMPKYRYRIVATRYQGSYVFLDTVKVNDVFHRILQDRRITPFPKAIHIRREFTIADSRFDFLLHYSEGKKALIEVKSCTLCHNGVAMFPDAPTERGRKHLRRLDALAAQGYETHVVFLVTNASARTFIPNYHVDYAYGQAFLKAENVKYTAYSLGMTNPVQLDLSTLREVAIDMPAVRRHCQKGGSYVLILENNMAQHIRIGQLGELWFPEGYYVYVGSGMNVLDSRIKRHHRKRKKPFWHIDYLTPDFFKPVQTHPLRSRQRFESSLATAMAALADDRINGFGATDTPEDSHLFYFRQDPRRRPEFLKIILDYRSKIE